MKVVIITTLYLTKMHYFATLHTCKKNIKTLQNVQTSVR